MKHTRLTLLLAICILLGGCAYKSTLVYTHVPGQGATVTAGGEASSPVEVTPSLAAVAGDKAIETGMQATPGGAVVGTVGK
jgi:uncharacterized protein YceK